MSPVVVGIIGLAMLFLLMFMRTPIFLSFLIIGFFGTVYFLGLGPALSALGMIPYTTMTMYSWTVVPLFVFMGYLALHAGLAEDFYAGVRSWVGHIRGGLATSVIIGNTAFGACTGDGISAAVTFTTMSLPEMRKYGYADSLTLGSIAAGSLLAPIIPPSLGFIIIGALTETSIAKLFIAGIFPGLLLAVFYMVIIYLLCQRNPQLGPPGPKTTFREKLTASPGMWPIIAIFVIIIGGLYLGLFTPTEAAASGAFVVLIMGLARRRLGWQGIKTAAKDGGVTAAMVGFLLVGCMQFNVFLVLTGLPQAVASFIGGITQSPTITLWLMVAVLFILGMFIDGLSMTILTVPIFFPLAVSMGIDPIHWAVVMAMMFCVGGLTPPFGMIVFTLSGIVRDVPLFTIFRAVIPFIITMVVCEAVLIYLPQISTFLPSKMVG